MKPKIFLTGATSYLGTKFIELYGGEFELLKVSRNGEIPLDLKDHNAIERAFEEFNPDFIVHLSADLKRHNEPAGDILKEDPDITRNLLTLAQRQNTPFVFTSTEAIYGGKEDVGNYVEDDESQPRNIYAESKVISEKMVGGAGIPYLITRGHRHVGVNNHYKGQKLFKEAFDAILRGESVHLDPVKLFTPTLLNNMCDVIVHFITSDADNQIILNVATEQSMTYFDLLLSIAKTLNIDSEIVKNDGQEALWPNNSSLNIDRLRKNGYPSVTKADILETIKKDVGPE